jgi:hypothetical protein
MANNSNSKGDMANSSPDMPNSPQGMPNSNKVAMDSNNRLLMVNKPELMEGNSLPRMDSSLVVMGNKLVPMGSNLQGMDNKAKQVGVLKLMAALIDHQLLVDMVQPDHLHLRRKPRPAVMEVMVRNNRLRRPLLLVLTVLGHGTNKHHKPALLDKLVLRLEVQ